MMNHRQPRVCTMIRKRSEKMRSRSFWIEILNMRLQKREKLFLAFTNFIRRIILIF